MSKSFPRKPGTYCLHCHRLIQERSKSQKTFSCTACGYRSQRRLIVDSTTRWNVVKGELQHFCAGVILWKKNAILLMKRATYPFKYSLIGGHMDRGETPLKALRREVREETGLTPNHPKLFFHGEVRNDRCRRSANRHVQWYYDARPKGKMKKNDESECLLWVPVAKLKNYPLTYLSRFILRKRGLLK